MDRRFVVAALMLVMTLASAEATVTSTAMPTIIGELHGLEHYSWVASLYLLASTVAMPLYGRLSDKFGRKRVIIGAVAIFSLSSLLAAAAQNMTQLILFRGLQGLGAGGIMPVVLTILGDIFTLEERAKIQGLFSAVWGIAAMAGPALGAFLVKTLGWRAIFFVNLPLGILGLLVLIWKYHEHHKPHPTDLDLPGVASLAVACTAVLTLVTRAGAEGLSWWMSLALLALSGGALTYFIRHERRAAHPIMPASLMLHRTIGPSLAASFLLGLAYMCIDTYVPLYIQGGRGGDASEAAGAITSVMLTWAIVNVFAAPLLIRWGFRKTALVGASLIAAGMAGLFICSWLAAPSWVLTVVLSLTGLGLGPCSLSYLLAPQEAVAWQQRGSVTSSIGFFRTIGGAIGVGMLGALFNLLLRPEFSRLQSQGIKPDAVLDQKLQQQLGATVVGSIHQAVASALVWVFAAMLLLALLQLAVTTLMPSRHLDHRIRPSEAFEAV